MTRSRWITGGILLVVAIAIVVALMMEATSNPTFRAEDHADHSACIAAIPPEWGPGSLERTGAEDACRYVHQRPMR